MRAPAPRHRFRRHSGHQGCARAFRNVAQSAFKSTVFSYFMASSLEKRCETSAQKKRGHPPRAHALRGPPGHLGRRIITASIAATVTPPAVADQLGLTGPTTPHSTRVRHAVKHLFQLFQVFSRKRRRCPSLNDSPPRQKASPDAAQKPQDILSARLTRLLAAGPRMTTSGKACRPSYSAGSEPVAGL